MCRLSILNRRALGNITVLTFIISLLLVGSGLAKVHCPLCSYGNCENHGLHLTPTHTCSDLSLDCLEGLDACHCDHMPDILLRIEAPTINAMLFFENIEIINLAPVLPGDSLQRHLNHDVASLLSPLSWTSNIPHFLENLSLLI